MSDVHALQIGETAISAPLAVPEYASPTTGQAPASTAPSSPPTASLGKRLVSLDAFRGITIAAMLLVNDPGKGTAYDALEHAPWHGWTPTDLIFPFFLFIVGVAIPFSMAKRKTTTQTTRGQMLGHVWIRALSIFMLGALLQGLSMSGISLHLGPRPAGTPIFTFGELPDGFTFLKILRVIAWSFTLCGVFALLIPYRSRKLQLWMPIAVTVGFLVLISAVAWANHHAWASGLPLDAKLGGGILRPDRYRIPGVLQRIGVCYGVAATIALFGGRRLILASLIGLLTIYSVIMLAVPIRHHQTGELIPWYSPQRLTKEDNVSRRVDEAVLDRWTTDASGKRDYRWKHTYSEYPDNEGLLSTIPAIGTSLLGILVGLWLRSDRTTIERAGGLLTAGVMLTILGYCLDAWLMPINKNLWTPSFVIFCGGMGMLGLGAMFWMIDVRGRRRWAWPLVVYGMNAIAAFVAANLLSKIQSLVHFQYNEKPVALGRYLTDHAADAVQVFSDRLQHLSPHFPSLATPQNTSLAYAVGFVAAVWVVMLVLYLCRIFIKV